MRAGHFDTEFLTGSESEDDKRLAGVLSFISVAMTFLRVDVFSLSSRVGVEVLGEISENSFSAKK